MKSECNNMHGERIKKVRFQFVLADCNFVGCESVDRSYCIQIIIMALTETINNNKTRDRKFKWVNTAFLFHNE